MPRPRELPDEGRVLPIYFTRSQVEALRRVASALGTSISQCVRDAVDLYLREVSVKLGLQLALGEREPAEQQVKREARQQKKAEQQDDPVLYYRQRRFEQQLRWFERSLAATERKWRKILSEVQAGYRFSPKPLPHDFLEELSDRESWLERILRNYADVARSPEFSARVRDLVERMLRLREEVDRVWEATSGR